MKYEIEIGKYSFIKTLIPFIFYLIILVFTMYNLSLKPIDDEILTNKILNYLNYPLIKEYIFDEYLIYIYNTIYFILFYVLYYVIEILYYHNNIATRMDNKKWIITKYIVGIIFTIIITTIEYFLITYIFFSDMPLNIKYYLFPILYRIMIMSLIFTIFNCLKTNKVSSLITLAISIIAILKFNIIICIGLIVTTFLLNYLFFDLMTATYKYNFRKINVKNKTN